MSEHKHLTDQQLHDLLDCMDDSDTALKLGREVKDCFRCLRAYRSLQRDKR